MDLAGSVNAQHPHADDIGTRARPRDHCRTLDIGALSGSWAASNSRGESLGTLYEATAAEPPGTRPQTTAVTARKAVPVKA